MSQTEAKVTIFACDSPTCSSQDVAQDEEQPSGTIGTVLSPEDGQWAAWYACKPAHVGKAVKAVLNVASIDEASEQTGLTGRPDS
jgi:hypothetical protein